MHKILYYIIGIGLLIVGLKIYYSSDLFHLKCIVSNVDGNRYCVREKEAMQDSADLLAKVAERCSQTVEYMKKKYPTDSRVKRLGNGFNPKNINETLPTSKLTAYSENKGEKVAFCLNKSKAPSHTNDELIDIDTVTFVALHELSHIMCKSYGHKQEFWDNFKFILDNAKEANIYHPTDYKKKPQDYCGMVINDNPFFDL